MVSLFFFHGLEGNPNGYKATMLKKDFPHMVVPLLPRDILERQKIIETLVVRPSILIGSSLGGLSAILFAMKHPHLVEKMLLLAPAVDVKDRTICTTKERELIQQIYLPDSFPCVIIAAINDEVIPLQSIEKFKEKSSVPSQIRLIKVEDFHGLGGSLDIVIDQAKKLIYS